MVNRLKQNEEESSVSSSSSSSFSSSGDDEKIRYLKEEYAEEIEEIRKQYKDREERHGSLIGQVVSVKNAKSIVVSVPYKKYLPKYNISVNRTSRIMAHDAEEVANVGDIVRIVPCRPMSAKKRHSLIDIVKPRKLSKFDPVRTIRSVAAKTHK